MKKMFVKIGPASYAHDEILKKKWKALERSRKFLYLKTDIQKGCKNKKIPSKKNLNTEEICIYFWHSEIASRRASKGRQKTRRRASKKHAKDSKRQANNMTCKTKGGRSRSPCFSKALSPLFPLSSLRSSFSFPLVHSFPSVPLFSLVPSFLLFPQVGHFP